jgi:hypothetical protein
LWDKLFLPHSTIQYRDDEKMEDQWVNKNVDLSVFNNRLVQFFEKKSFATSQESSEEKYHIVARPRRFHDVLEEIHVYVNGQPDNFRVKFDAGSHSSKLVRFGILTTAFGGGRLTLKGLKSQEALEKLEREFWIYLDKAIWNLANVASDSAKRQ